MRKIKFIKKIYKGEETASGAECLFFKVSNTVGIKIYWEEKRAISANLRQKEAYKHKIGPKVLSKVYKVRWDNKTRFAYKTQIAEVIDDTKFESSIEGQYLIAKVKEVFGTDAFQDGETVRHYNTGRIKDRVVVIDFGNCSFGYT